MSKLSIGIVGLPNVGKSTLFQALTRIAVPAENYPFCTIDPNVGVVEVPDPRLQRIADLVEPQAVIPNAGGVAPVCHVIRCFEDATIVETGDVDDPDGSREIVEVELTLADLEVVERALDKAERRRRTGDKEGTITAGALERLQSALAAGTPARRVPLETEEIRLVRSLSLLTRKPAMYVANVAEHEANGGSERSDRLRAAVAAQEPQAEVVVLSARLEADLLALDEPDRAEYLAAHGLAESGINELIRAGYRLLGLSTFFTAGEKEVRAWTVPTGAKAPQAAGVIHTDFERGFIRAETIHYDEFVVAGSLKRARELGLMRLEGKEYEVIDGDLMLFRSAT